MRIGQYLWKIHQGSIDAVVEVAACCCKCCCIDCVASSAACVEGSRFHDQASRLKFRLRYYWSGPVQKVGMKKNLMKLIRIWFDEIVL